MPSLTMETFTKLQRVTIPSGTWRIEPLFPRFSTPFFRSLRKPQDVLKECQREMTRLRHCRLRLTQHSHNVTELIVDTNYELTSLSHQFFGSSGWNTGYAATLQLFRTSPLTRLGLCLSNTLVDEANFICFHNGLLKIALSHFTSPRYLALGSIIDTADNER
jgi:hypothetical protein